MATATLFLLSSRESLKNEISRHFLLTLHFTFLLTNRPLKPIAHSINTPIMLFKIRNRSSSKDKKAGIFRKKSSGKKGSKDATPSDAPPSVEQVLTMTLSEDSADGHVESPQNEATSSDTIVFTQQQVMENALRQMREVTELNER